jgi:hypothetical protein
MHPFDMCHPFHCSVSNRNRTLRLESGDTVLIDNIKGQETDMNFYKPVGLAHTL